MDKKKKILKIKTLAWSQENLKLSGNLAVQQGSLGTEKSPEVHQQFYCN
jgi:hypothetical protein